MMLRDTIAKRLESLASPDRKQLIALSLGVLLLIAGCATSAPVRDSAETTSSDDFEDGDAVGWRNVGTGTDAVVDNKSIEGQYSLYAASQNIPGTTNDPAFRWLGNGGPTLDFQQAFDVSGTMQYMADRDEGVVSTVRVGLTGDRQGSTGQNAVLLFDYGDNETRIGTYLDDESGEAIDNDFYGEWVNFRLQSDTNDGTLRAKVWNASESEPQDWQIERGGFDGVTGSFGVNPGYNDAADREIWLDSVTVQGTLAFDPRLRLETRQLYQPNETHPYEVRYLEQDGERNQSFDVTDNASVISRSPDVISADEEEHTLTSADNTTAQQVLVGATYNNSTSFIEVTVANPTVENLPILPGIWRVVAIGLDPTMFALLIATLLAVPAARYTSAFGGLAIGQMVIVVGWFAGYVSFGIAASSLFVALFIGLNLAANINYMGSGGFQR